MNRYMMRHRPMFNNMNRTGRKYRGVMEPMSRMTMDFQGRFMDSQGRMVDPRNYENYGRYNDFDRYYGRPMFNSGPHMEGQRYGGGMDYPERYMDMSGYQMDMQGRWMDMQGRHCSPFNQWGQNRPGHYSGYSHGRYMYNPERYMDMSNYQMDMQGRWMDNYGRYVSPFSQSSMYGRNMHYPHYNSSRYMDYPERYMDMTGYQMDMQGRWLDMQGRHCNPFNQWGHNKSSNYPSYGRNMYYPERYMDTPNYPMFGNTRSGRKYRGMMEPMSRMTMDFQGRYMDSQGRMVDPKFSDNYGRYNECDRYYPRSMFNYRPYMDGQRYGNWMDFPERYMDMSGYQMDMQGRWMDNYGRYMDPSSSNMYDGSYYMF